MSDEDEYQRKGEECLVFCGASGQAAEGEMGSQRSRGHLHGSLHALSPGLAWHRCRNPLRETASVATLRRDTSAGEMLAAARASGEASEEREEVSGKMAANNRCAFMQGKAIGTGNGTFHHRRVSDRGFAPTRNPISLYCSWGQCVLEHRPCPTMVGAARDAPRPRRMPVTGLLCRGEGKWSDHGCRTFLRPSGGPTLPSPRSAWFITKVSHSMEGREESRSKLLGPQGVPHGSALWPQGPARGAKAIVGTLRANGRSSLSQSSERTSFLSTGCAWIFWDDRSQRFSYREGGTVTHWPPRSPVALGRQRKDCRENHLARLSCRGSPFSVPERSQGGSANCIGR